jgi:hypothetical protein
MFAQADFHVDYAQSGAFTVSVPQAAKAGAHLVVTVDGRPAAERVFPAAAADQACDAELTASLPAGRHVVRLENRGADWVVLGRLTLSPYGPSRQALAKASKTQAAVWVHGSSPSDSHSPGPAKVTVPGLLPGRYRVRWWDTHTGKELLAQSASLRGGQPLLLTVPTTAVDVAAFAARIANG